MNSDNQCSQIKQASRINFFGEPKTQPIYSASRKSNYTMAFYGGDDWSDEYLFNTTAWD